LKANHTFVLNVSAAVIIHSDSAEFKMKKANGEPLGVVYDVLSRMLEKWLKIYLDADHLCR
jgi:hypothetical protein